jgi:miniconductance mechanosensitive channel
MIELITPLLKNIGLDPDWTERLAILASIVVLLLVCFIAYLITRYLVLRILAFYIRNNRFSWDNYFLERKVFHRMCHLLPAVLLYTFSVAFGDLQQVIHRLASIYITIVVVFVIDAFLKALDDIYNSYEVARKKPIKAYLQGIKIFVVVVALIIIIARIIDKSPVLLLSGVGAMTAVVLLIFQDSILGFVAGIQLATNDMLRIGDRIEMPKHNADGTVVDISLTTVKVENFDQTITTIPTHALVKDSFRNWRSMIESGTRRIKRSVYIDVATIRFCTDEMLQQFRRIHLLTGYLDQRLAEINAYNQERNIDTDQPVNGRRLTNIGIFRIYIQNYLRAHPKLNQDMPRMVRQLSSNEHGLPIEIYAFAATADWADFETIQADIFDHIFAVAPHFGLRIFQTPGGHDLRALSDSIKQDGFLK